MHTDCMVLYIRNIRECSSWEDQSKNSAIFGIYVARTAEPSTATYIESY